MLTAILDKSHQRNLHRSVMNACKSPDCGRKRARKRQTKRQKERERERLFGACFCFINTCNDMHTCCLTANFVYIWFLSTTLHFSFFSRWRHVCSVNLFSTAKKSSLLFTAQTQLFTKRPIGSVCFHKIDGRKYKSTSMINEEWLLISVHTSMWKPYKTAKIL